MPPAVQDSSSKVGGEPKTKQKPHKSSKAKLVNLLVILILLPIHRLLHLFCHLPVPVMVFLKRNTDLPQQEVYDEFSSEEDSIVEEGEVSSDVIDRQDQTEDMTYRETVRSIRSFMGWSHIPVYESDLSEPDKSNNPWKGKNAKKLARFSVAMPPDD